MRRSFLFALPALAAFALAGCGETADDAGGPDGEASEASGVTPPLLADEEGAELEISLQTTPMEERVATIGLLNKRNNVTTDFEITPGTVVEDGAVIIRLEACERTAPYEFPQETGAFVQVDIRERGESDHTRVFSGWLFKENPSLNIVEHPIYDVWIKDCAMSFPGDE
ncbi:MAG: DUF2155 domain-containing protein [Pseudomonadota bacterium]